MAVGVLLSGLLVASAVQAAPPPLAVSGNTLRGAGQPVQLRGVDYSFLDSNCAYSDPEPNTAQTIAAMEAWRLNTVRLTVDPHCWLGDRDPVFDDDLEPFNTAAYPTAAAYQRAVLQRVSQFEAAGFWVIIAANLFDYMPSPDWVPFWHDVAADFASNRGVLFDPVGEVNMGENDQSETPSLRDNPNYSDPSLPPWQCWEDGCTVNSMYGGDWQAPGMQALVTTIRAAGATTQPITLGSPGYDAELDHWLQYLPSDPDHGLILDTHRYDFVDTDEEGGTPGNGAGDTGFDDFLTGTVVPIAEHVPVEYGEVGEVDCDQQETDGYTANALRELDAVNSRDGLQIGAIGYEWRTSGGGYGCPTGNPPGSNGPGGPLLLENYDGTPTLSEGAAFRSWFLVHATAATPGPGEPGGGTIKPKLSSVRFTRKRHGEAITVTVVVNGVAGRVSVLARSRRRVLTPGRRGHRHRRRLRFALVSATVRGSGTLELRLTPTSIARRFLDSHGRLALQIELVYRAAATGVRTELTRYLIASH